MQLDSLRVPDLALLSTAAVALHMFCKANFMPVSAMSSSAKLNE